MFRLRILARSLLVPLSLYSFAAIVAGYFVWHGLNGHRGLKAGEEFEQQLAKLRFERNLLKYERMQWESRISLIRGETVDADILDDEARAVLGRVHKHEVVILTEQTGAATR